MVARELLFFFSALGAFNGVLLGLYVLFFAKEKHFSNKFLGLLLLALSVRIGKSVFMFFSESLSHYYIHGGLIACALIGPFLFFYVDSVKTEKRRPLLWTLVLSAVVIGLCIVCYIYPYNEYYDLWQVRIIPMIYYEWLLFNILAGVHLLGPFKNIFTRVKNSRVDSWLLNVYLGNVIIWIAYKTFFYTSYIVGALSFSFILYLLLVMIFLRRRTNIEQKKEKYADKKISDSKANELLERLNTVMMEEKLYRNPKLKLPDLASKLHVLPHTISQVLNDNVGLNFSQYLNQFRIDEAKKMIGKASHLSIEGIGKECGFNSNSTFYATFKKFTGTTPAKYKAS